ncbi:MAG: hypothetical protein RBR47_07975 [Bacteroidales bacterium]|jgi:hypothetical protein|nr:hypothetical protein [Bacteroidales bacterium]MDD3131212.1 hypothetical protein [Bacteroidales bacterium]MDD3526401.1 hypothetical protein [Bacteroidales bacterium]MDD4739933.1 hypothetical protein [Bacteroidales bacterium]MDY0334882.1 hypothetical protein [Bacteroidales bacterium]
MNTDMIIEKTNKEIVFRLPHDTNIDVLQNLKDWLEYLEVTRKSTAKQEDVDAFVDEIKKDRWNRRKSD